MIIDETETEFIHDDVMIDDYRLKLYLSKHGYLKKIPLTSLRSAGEIKTKEDDEIAYEIETSNKTDVVFFSNKSNVYKMKTHEIRDHKPSELGDFLTNLLSLDEGENIIYIHSTIDYAGNLIIAFENGKIAKIPFATYETKTNRKKLINAYSDKSPVVDIRFLESEQDFAAFSNINKILVFNSKLIPLKTTRTTNGVQVLISKKGSTLSELKLLSETNIIDTEYYRNKRIPAVGYYVKEDTIDNKQISFES